MLDGATLLHPTAGTPQGGVVSPLLANVYLNTLDWWWERHGGRFGSLTRFADDFVILCGRQDQAEQAKAALAVLLAKLKPSLSEAKTRVVGLDDGRTGFDFLGYHYRWLPTKADPRRRYAACWPSQRVMQAARQRIRDLTPPQRIGLPISVVVQDLNRFLQGWAGYFRHGNSTRRFKSLDAFVTARLCRFISRKHGRRGLGRGFVTLLSSKTQLGLYRTAGTVRYDSATAGRERARRAV